jgi:hypothetical protein
MADEVLINGLQHSWASTECKMDSEKYAGLTKISWEQSVEETMSRGQGPNPRGRTRGRYVPGTVSITMAKSSAQAFKAALAAKSSSGTAWATVVFPITLQYLEPNDTPITVEFIQCRLLKSSAANEEGPDPSQEDLEISTMKILENGLSAMDEVT